MISCNHFAITTTYLHGYLQICCKKRPFHRKIYSNSERWNCSVGRAKTLSECLLAHFSYEVHTTKKVSENSETFILGAENESLTYVRPSFWDRKSCDFLGLLLSSAVTVLTVFQVRELPYCVHLKFLCCNYLCNDNKISSIYKKGEYLLLAF